MTGVGGQGVGQTILHSFYLIYQTLEETMTS